jgi:peptide/nickel transport system substrate-binding protein
MIRSSLHLATISAGLAIVGLLAGEATAQAPTPKRGGTAIIAIGSDPTVLNPVINSGSAEVNTACFILEGLVVLNNVNEKFEPALAESWTISPDGKTYTFKLRKTNWHDGTPFTSEDVRFTIDVMAKVGPTFAAQAGKALESVTTPDPQTVEIKLKESYGPLLRVLTCHFGGSILPAHLYKSAEVRTTPVNQKPVGTGPFKFADWAPGDRIRLVKNDKYWDTGKPYLDGAVVRIMPNAASRTQALLAGEVDYIQWTYFPPSDGKTVDANPNTKREITGYPPNMLYAFFNLKRKPLDDVKVRHALLAATDRKFIFDAAFYGLGKPGTAPWAKQIAWTDDPSINYDKSHPFSPEKAAQMLDEAGYKPDANGIRFRLSIAYDAASSERSRTALALQEMWKRVGVELTVQPLEAAVLIPRVHAEGNFDVYMSSYQSYGDPAIGVGRAYISGTIGGSFGNAASYSNPEVDALFAKAAALTVLEERAAIYRQIQPILMRDLPAITLHENRSFDAASKKLVGGWGYMGNIRLGDAWLEK